MKKSILLVSGAMMILMLAIVGFSTIQLSETMNLLSIEVHEDASEQILARNGGDKLGLEDSEPAEKEKRLDDVLIAYAPDPAYAKPLGETKVHDSSSNKNRTILTTVMIQITVISVLTVVALLMGTIVWRQVRRSNEK